MAEEEKTGTEEQPEQETPATPAEAEKTDTPAGSETTVPDSWDDIFKHPRFKELTERAKTAESKLSEIEKAKAEAERKAAEEQGKYKELYEEMQTEAEKAKAEKQALELSILRRKVADDVGLPGALADRLKGETEDELREDAESLLETLPKKDAPSLNGGAGNRNRNKEKGDTPTLEELQEQAAVYGLSFESLKQVYGYTE